jgi:hypothetical protein
MIAHGYTVIHGSIPVVDIASPEAITHAIFFGATTLEFESSVFMKVTVIGMDT